MKKSNKIGLVLSGGGAKGAFQAGVITSLMNGGIKFNVVSGTSVGALNGSAIATGQGFELEKIWANISKGDVFKKRSIASLATRQLFSWFRFREPPLGLHDTDPLKATIKKVIGTKTPIMPFYAPRVNLVNGNYRSAVTNHKFKDQVLGSASIPIVFDPVIMNRKHSIIVDGGVRAVSPIKEMFQHNLDKIVIVPTQPIKSAASDVDINNFVDAVKQTISIMMDEIFKEDIERFLEINNIVRQAEEQGFEVKNKKGIPYKYYKETIIQPDRGLGDPLDFSRSSLDERFNHGLMIGENMIHRLR